MATANIRGTLVKATNIHPGNPCCPMSH